MQEMNFSAASARDGDGCTNDPNCDMLKNKEVFTWLGMIRYLSSFDRF
jgi:hypothetical protein